MGKHRRALTEKANIAEIKACFTSSDCRDLAQKSSIARSYLADNRLNRGGFHSHKDRSHHAFSIIKLGDPDYLDRVLCSSMGPANATRRQDGTEPRCSPHRADPPKQCGFFSPLNRPSGLAPVAPDLSSNRKDEPETLPYSNYQIYPTGADAFNLSFPHLATFRSD